MSHLGSLLFTLEQDLALRLLGLDVSFLMDEPSGSRTLSSPGGEELLARLKRQLCDSGDFLVDGVARLCLLAGLSLDSYLPTALVAEQTALFNSWAKEGEGASEVDLNALYARFPNAVHQMILASTGRGPGLAGHAGASAWLAERGLDVSTFTREAGAGRSANSAESARAASLEKAELLLSDLVGRRALAVN